MGPYRRNAIRGGILTGYSTTLYNSNLIVENIMMNDDRNGSEYSCVIIPAQGMVTLTDIIHESNATILYVAGEYWYRHSNIYYGIIIVIIRSDF